MILSISYIYTTIQYFLPQKEKPILRILNETEFAFSQEDGFFRPGDRVEKVLMIKNNGSDASSYVIYLDHLKGDMKSYVTVNLFTDDQLLYSAPITTFTRSTPFEALHELKPNGTVHYRIELVIDEGVGEEFQDEQLIFDLIVQAKGE